MTFWANHRNTLIAIAAVLIAAPFVASRPVWLDSAVILGVYALLALSVGISYGQAGILTMSQGAFASVGAYAAALCSARWGWPPFTDLVLAMLLPAVLAYGVGRVVTRLSPLATALATLALGSVISIYIRHADDLTGGYVGFAGIPAIGFIDTPLEYAVLAWLLVIAVVYGYENLMRSAHGRALNVLQQDQARARADGIDVARSMSAAFALSAAIAGIAGWLYAHYVSVLSPESLDTNISVTALLMAVVGGAGYVLGPIIGTVLFDTLTRLLPAAELQGLFYGLALVVILLVARTGLMGLGEQLIGAARSGLGRRAAPAAGLPARAAS
ncbi:branched-chain amino acid ABC transporter permease [Chelatococcus reniformis]|uniref:Branched-chain amino acid ABC transporter permease n=1 Tax=Chelatococcus reniformis TaxID=1494448 RepID=A0A916XFA8_9HYPH|nr:branched-chain amino acid ABC transporter permease [Chelatococcus reniformis]GGC66374.1 hypothetical protein GCM10010994_26200 [Chelatococcus reniformis]